MLIIFIYESINVSRFVVTGCAAKMSAIVTFHCLHLISLFAFCFYIFFFFLVLRPPPRSTLFPYTTLFRSAPEEIKTLVVRALSDNERGLGQYEVRMHDDALEFLAQVSDGDARRALAALEIGVLSSHDRPVEFTRELAAESVQRKASAYDPTGDEHYDSASALIKSIRGSDPDARSEERRVGKECRCWWTRDQ